jgi:hypothetical protein
MRKTMFVSLLAMTAAVAGCSAADGGSAGTIEQTVESTAAVTGAGTATISEIGTFPVESFEIQAPPPRVPGGRSFGPTQATITGLTGAWVQRALAFEGRIVASAELYIGTRTYTMSNVIITSVHTMPSHVGSGTLPVTTVGLTFENISVQ